jgi:hypothetical protein
LSALSANAEPLYWDEIRKGSLKKPKIPTDDRKQKKHGNTRNNDQNSVNNNACARFGLSDRPNYANDGAYTHNEGDISCVVHALLLHRI